MAKSKRHKVPRVSAEPKAASKKPRQHHDPEASNRETPAWLFSTLDFGVTWGKGASLSVELLRDEILPKIRSYESMTWAQIVGNAWRDHAVPVEHLAKEAQDRLTALNLDDLEELFRLRLAGTQRLWGIRDRRYFKLLWWDPDHVVCPSPKRS